MATPPGPGKSRSASESRPMPRPASAPAPYADNEPEDRETVIAVFGGTTRSGPWLPPEETRAVAGFANVHLDFTQADLPAGVTEVDAYALFGNVVIRVPPTLPVDLNAIALFGKVVHQSQKGGEVRKQLRRWLRLPDSTPEPAPVHPDDEAVLCVRGTAVFGNIIVEVTE